MWVTATSVLFIGGTGVISAASVQEALSRGMDVTVLNRGSSTDRPVPAGVTTWTADIRDPDAVSKVVGGQEFDVVADFMSFTPAQLQSNLGLFSGRFGQYVFISSASAYQKPPARLPVVESTALRNPFWQYSRDKIACEDILVGAYRDHGLPITIVRPSHTYDRTSIPFGEGWTIVDRMRRGAEIVIHGDGTSLWTLTHTTDFAQAFVRLLGHPGAIGDSFHITSDESLSWNQVVEALAVAAGATPRIVHITSETINAADPEWGAGLLGDKAHSMVFDNSKIKSIVPGWRAKVPFWLGAQEIIAWYDAVPARQVVDRRMDRLVDQLVASAGSAVAAGSA
jgi:nucleoside-diphosphate-sugar epimerase